MAIIDADRLLSDLRELSTIGVYKTGVHRPTFSSPDLQARQWLLTKLTAAGLAAKIDGIGNVIGYSSAKRLALVGSHIESQPYAGRLDGALGVLYGLELARVFRGRDIGVDVGAWCDEEGFYGRMLGSRSFCGDLAPGELEAARHRDDGTLMVDDLARVGYADHPRELIDVSRYAAYCEAHIEQGDWLEATNKRVGIVSAIVGMWCFKIKAFGVQNHAGTTRMAIRKDAGVALCNLVTAINQQLPHVAGEKSVWTTGRMDFFPGAYTIIPGEAEIYFEIRDTDPATLQRMYDCVIALINQMNADGPCRIEFTVDKTPPTPMADHIIAAMQRSADKFAANDYLVLPSAAGHDACHFGKIMPSGMLFVPSIGGISHHYTEDTKEEDIVLGCQVFADAVEQIIIENT